jgi:hypothetical protein
MLDVLLESDLSILVVADDVKSKFSLYVCGKFNFFLFVGSTEVYALVRFKNLVIMFLLDHMKADAG